MAPLKDIAIIIGNTLTSASEAQSSQKLKYEKEAVRSRLRTWKACSQDSILGKVACLTPECLPRLAENTEKQKADP